MRTHPFSKTDVQMLVSAHAAMLAGVAVFAAVSVYFNLRNRSVGPGVLPEWLRLVAYADILLPLLALAASRMLHTMRIARAHERLRDRAIHIEAFKSQIRSAYLMRAAILEGPALLGLAAVLSVALKPGNIFAAPPVHLALFLGAVLFAAETIRVLPTESRLDAVFRAYNPD